MKKKCILFSFLSVFIFLFASCDLTFNAPVRQYLEYWSQAVTVGRYEVASETTVAYGQKNLSAVEPIEVELLLVNPQNYNIEFQNADGVYFKIYLNTDETKQDIATAKTATLSPDKTVITLSAKLPDNAERKNLMIEGYFYYFKEAESFTIPYSYSFMQLSAPDVPRNLTNPSSAEADGYHCVHFETPNTNLNRNKDLTYRVECYSRVSADNFSFLASADIKPNQTKASGKADEIIYYFDEQEPSLQYEYVVTAISPEGVKSKPVSTSAALGLCYVTEPEIIFATNGELNDLTADKEGEEESYDVVEYSGDSFSVSVVKTDSSSNLDVKVNGEAVSENVTLEDGFNKIVATASKNLARPVTVTKNIYVTKKLVEPTFTTNAVKNGTTKVNGVNYDVMQYSYLNYENCTYQIDNSANADSTISFSIDEAKASLSGILNDGNRVLEINVTKEHCRPVKIEKKFNVGIRRVKAKVINKLHHWHTDGGKDVDLIVELFIASTRTGQRSIWSCNYEHIDNSHDYYSVTQNEKVVYLDEKTDCFYFYTSKAWDRDGKSQSNWDHLGTINKGDSTATRTLQQLKANPSIDTGDHGGDKDCRSRYWINLELSEDAAEPLFEFTPERNGMSDSNSYEYIEVANSLAKASYKISPQDGASISGKVDGVSFTGTKTGELAVGQHTITVTSAKLGYTSCHVTKHIYVIAPLSEPSLYFYANNTTNRIYTSDEPVVSYETYDIPLTASGTGVAKMEVSLGTGESVTVEDGDDVLTASNGQYELSLGPHELTITVSKTGYSPMAITKNIYIQGILADPDVVKVTSTDIESGSGNSQQDPKVIKFNYLSADTLTCRIKPGNTDNTVELHKSTEDGDVISNATTGFDAGCETVLTLVIIQSRQYCKTLKTTKYVKGMIKPITLKYEVDSIGDDLQVDLAGFGENSFNARGEVSVWASVAQSFKAIWHYEGSNHGVRQGGWCTIRDTDAAFRSWSADFSSPKDTVKIRFTKFRRDRNNKSDIFFRNGDYDFPEIKLSDIKKGKGESSTAGTSWTYICDKKYCGDQGARPKVRFTATEKK
ncbi:hypothetical protein [Treponema sp.]|uniref:hypothetical protein n=1 Tax=Treponema sp. TaxID=166 RepID=UPI00298DBBF6|nr:hypothetical protein [Treponema sp.]MCR5613390.1 hypothetical protein [Treponema sp.]